MAKSPPRMQLATARVDPPRSFEAPSPIPNLFQTLGRSLSSMNANEPTPPLTPAVTGSPTGEELFFKLAHSENPPLGSPSEPSFTRKLNQPKPRPTSRPEPTSVESNEEGQGPGDGYFSLPPAPTRYREKRRSSASDRPFKGKSWHIEKTDQGNGGLKNAVEAAIAAGTLDDKTWVGTLGFPTDGLDDSVKVAIEGRLREDCDSIVAFPSDKDFDGHYNHYCKEVCGQF